MVSKRTLREGIITGKSIYSHDTLVDCAEFGTHITWQVDILIEDVLFCSRHHYICQQTNATKYQYLTSLLFFIEENSVGISLFVLLDLYVDMSVKNDS